MREYTESEKTFRKENLQLWNEKLLEVFNGKIPIHYEWDNIFQIKNIINEISVKNLNHMLYPDGGGLDIVGCDISSRKGNLLEIMTEVPNVCMPRQLVFDSINMEPEWSYFRLELNNMNPSGCYSSDIRFFEEVYESMDGRFEPYNDFIPDGNFRHIARLLKGTLLIVPKSCYYNNLSFTYDGIHNKYNHVSFRTIMENWRLSEGYKSFLKNMS